MNPLRLLFLGDIVGEPGRKAVKYFLTNIRETQNIDVIVVNGENSAAGRGITPKIARGLFEAGADAITTGDHVWDQKDIIPYLDEEPRIIRPLNYEKGTPGKGHYILETEKGKVAIIQAQGRTFIQPPLQNPFTFGPSLAKKLRTEEEVKMIFCDFHAEATSEKIAFGHVMDGLISGVVGTHTHVQTADEQILPKGTAFLCDAGMCGPNHSVLGREVESVVWKFTNCLPTRFPVAKGPVRICGAIIEIDPKTGNSLSIERISELIEEETYKLPK